ncbi:MAG: hypothetical protein LBF60_07555 [Treponema sp.]|jgi:hypothetical protein|nr:hypothetical protein [Treponema sp.]
MAEHRDYSPQKETELTDWADNFIQQASQNAAAWQIPQDEATNLQTKQIAFKGLHSECAAPNRTKPYRRY